MGKKKIVFIGNSIVNGFPHKRSQGFVSQVREETGYEIINKGNNGETTRDILNRFQHDVIEHHPNMVFIMSGTNDFIYREATPSVCCENIIQMIKLSRAEGIIPVIMTPVPVDIHMASLRWMAGAGVDYAGVLCQLREFSQLLIQYADNNNVALIDVFEAFGKYASQEDVNSVYYDGIHPSVEGHRFISQMVINYLSTN